MSRSLFICILIFTRDVPINEMTREKGIIIFKLKYYLKKSFSRCLYYCTLVPFCHTHMSRHIVFADTTYTSNK